MIQVPRWRLVIRRTRTDGWMSRRLGRQLLSHSFRFDNFTRVITSFRLTHHVGGRNSPDPAMSVGPLCMIPISLSDPSLYLQVVMEQPLICLITSQPEEVKPTASPLPKQIKCAGNPCENYPSTDLIASLSDMMRSWFTSSTIVDLKLGFSEGRTLTFVSTSPEELATHIRQNSPTCCVFTPVCYILYLFAYIVSRHRGGMRRQ